MVDQVDLDSERVSLRDATFAEATGFPIFRSEPIWVIRQYLEQEAAPVKPEKLLTAEDVTDIKVESSSYSAVSREKEYHLTCKINGVPDTLVYTVSQHDDGEGFTIQSQKDDIWNKMSRPSWKSWRMCWPERWSLTTGVNPSSTQQMRMLLKWWLWTTAGQKT